METKRILRFLPVWSLLVLAPVMLMAQEVTVLKQRKFPKTVSAGNYSGITWLGGSRYAVANDKSPTAGFYLMTIKTDSISGELLSVCEDSFLTSGQPNRDEEGICYMPQTQTVFVSGEKDQEILEYNLQGQLTGRKLHIPEIFKAIYPNGGFEALTYQPQTHRFWTTTEFTLKADGEQPTIERKIGNRLRLQSFGDDLQPKEQYWYETDSTIIKKRKGRSILGVSGLAALEDGRIVVLEREMYFPKKQIGSYSLVKLYLVNPSQQQPGEVLRKTLLTEFRTKVNLTRRNFANYEGICIGPKLADGRQLLVLICDSQNQYRGIMRDWFKTIVLP
ncbi:MAG: esterase-like activity of phytase family protein [Prevotella sp.]|nr:esterase-like activity of phytase family protein [Prevotella sp.]